MVRKIFNDTGFSEVKIVGSGGLDEYGLSELSAAQIPFDSYGVETKMGTSSDAPWSDMASKLVEYGDKPVLREAPIKVSWPGAKQLFRQKKQSRTARKKYYWVRHEHIPGTEPLLRKVMESGKVGSVAYASREPGRFS